VPDGLSQADDLADTDAHTNRFTVAHAHDEP
jgi:hypothetical protein